MADLWGLHTGYRFDAPDHISVTRHSSEEIPKLAQEVWDQDGPRVLWGALSNAHPDEHAYIARDPSGTIHGVGLGNFDTEKDGADFDSPDSYSNYLRLNHLYTSLKAPPGTGNRILQDAAQHGMDTGHHLMVNGAMPHTTDYYNQMGVEQWGGDRGQHGYWSDDSQRALVAGDSIPGTESPVRHDHELYEPVPRASRLPGSARNPHTAATDGIRYAHIVEADVAEDLRRLAMPTYYHYTYNPSFKPDPNFKPWNHFGDPSTAGHDGRPVNDKPGLFVSPDPDGWSLIDQGKRPHRVELNGPSADDNGDERGSFIPGDKLNQYTVKGVTPNQYWEEHHSPEAQRREWEERGRLAAVNQELVDRLKGEFHRWWNDEGGSKTYRARPGEEDRGPIGHWPNIENFLGEKYPAAYRGHDIGMEEAGWILDGHEPMPYQERSGIDLSPYETGPEALDYHGYDPKEIAAGMLLLHNQSHPLRGNMSQQDQDRLNDIFMKRQQMQRSYEQRTKTATFNQDLVDRLRGEFHDWWKTAPEDPDDDREWEYYGDGSPMNSWAHIWSTRKTAMPTVYHGTDEDKAQAILDSQSWLPGNGGWFSTDLDRAKAYGPAVVGLDVPDHLIPKRQPEFYIPHGKRILRKGPFTRVV